MELPEDLRPEKPINGKTITTFEDVVNLFKKEIEFRDNDLYIGVKVAISNNLPKHDIDKKLLETLRGCNFYTNTEYVLKAIEIIFNMIRARSESLKIQIKCSLIDNDQSYQLEILHVNSYSDKELTHPKIMLKEGLGDMAILRTTLNSLCDFSIESRFKNENNEFVFARIDYLYDGVDREDWKPRKTMLDEEVNGFKFLLKFPAK